MLDAHQIAASTCRPLHDDQTAACTYDYDRQLPPYPDRQPSAGPEHIASFAFTATGGGELRHNHDYDCCPQLPSLHSDGPHENTIRQRCPGRANYQTSPQRRSNRLARSSEPYSYDRRHDFVSPRSSRRRTSRATRPHHAGASALLRHYDALSDRFVAPKSAGELNPLGLTLTPIGSVAVGDANRVTADLTAAVQAGKIPQGALDEYNRILDIALQWNHSSPGWGFNYRCSAQAGAMQTAIIDTVWGEDHRSTQYWQVAPAYRQMFENENLVLGLGSHAATMLVPLPGNNFQYDITLDGYKGVPPTGSSNSDGNITVQTPETFNQGYKYGDLPRRY